MHLRGAGLESTQRPGTCQRAGADNKKKKAASMSRTIPFTQDPPADDPELEGTDGGWDPYVTALLTGGTGEAHPAAGDDESLPVMSLARVEQRRAR